MNLFITLKMNDHYFNILNLIRIGKRRRDLKFEITTNITKVDLDSWLKLE